MCARVGIIATYMEAKEYFDIKNDFNFTKSYNIAPSQNVPVILHERICKMYKWGLLPIWANDKTKPQINVRSETIHEKPFFKSAFKNQRCIIPASFWYEWQDTEDGKQPYCFKPKDNNILAIAGIYQNETFAIITKEADKQCHGIHSRMPVIIKLKQLDDWLSNKELGIENTKSLFKKDNNLNLDIYKVNKKVNMPIYNELDCIKRL